MKQPQYEGLASSHTHEMHVVTTAGGRGVATKWLAKFLTINGTEFRKRSDRHTSLKVVQLSVRSVRHPDPT